MLVSPRWQHDEVNMRVTGRNPRRSRVLQRDDQLGSPSAEEPEWDGNEAEAAEERPSKTARKKEMLEYQSMAATLLELSSRIWGEVPFSERMDEALREAPARQSHGAYRRYLRWLGGLLSQEDEVVLTRLREVLAAGPNLETRQLHFAEQWRDRLLDQGESALPELAALAPELDRAQWSALLRQAQQELRSGAKPLAKRRLFQQLKLLYRE